MPTIISLSSQVAYGHVGHSANQFVWQRLGLDVIALPTIILSNRPDYAHHGGERLSPKLLERMIEALGANGWLGRVDAVFTGYLPSPEHVAIAARLVASLKKERAGLLYCCDPIIGDEPEGLYVPETAALALRSQLLPLADLITPNRFELGWLAGQPVGSAEEAVAAARSLGPMVLATSAPDAEKARLANLLVAGDEAWLTLVRRREAVPHGTGDLMASLFLAHLLGGHMPEKALGLATSGIEVVISASEGSDELQLIGSQDAWAAASPWSVDRLSVEDL